MKNARSRGLALIEVLLAIAMVSIVMVTIYNSFSNSLTIIADAQKRALNARRYSILYKILERDIQNIFYPQDNKLRFFLMDRRGGVDDAQDKITFISLFPEVSIFGNQSPLREISYFLVEDELSSSGQRMYKLIRREKLGIDSEPDKGGSQTVLARNLTSMLIEATLTPISKDWSRTWDYKLNLSYPRAIRIQLKFNQSNLPANYNTMTIWGLVSQDKPKT